MGKTDIWMPLYIGDYLADTIGLTRAEHGSYLIAIMAYWKKGSALTEKEFHACCMQEASTLSKFFKIENGLWFHSKIEKELAKSLKVSNNLSIRGKLGADKRWSNNATSIATSNAQAMPNNMLVDAPSHTQPQPHTQPHKEKGADKPPVSQKTVFKKPSIEEIAAYCAERSNKADPNSIFDYYESNGWRVGKNPMKDWRSAVRNWERRSFKQGELSKKPSKDWLGEIL
jgi:uncharacterized protein YdaU (DUF1376 family)